MDRSEPHRKRRAVFRRVALRRHVSSLLLGAVTAALFGHAMLMLRWGDRLSVTVDLFLQVATIAVFWWWCTLRSGSLLSAPYVFVLAIFFWHSGFLAGRYFKVNDIFEFSGSVLTYGENYIPRAVAVISICIALAVVGTSGAWILLRLRPALRRRGRTGAEAASGRSRWSAVETYAWVLFSAYLLLSCLYELIEGRAALSGSYTEVYGAASGTVLYRLYQMTKFLGVPVIASVIALSRTKGRFRAAVAGVLLLAFVSALTGARTMPFLYVATMVLSLDYFRRRVPLKVIVILALAGAAASWVMSEARATGVGLHVFSLSTAEEGISLWHLVWNSGGSVRAVLRTMAFTADAGPEYGKTFAEALVYVIPSPIVSAAWPEFNPRPPSVWMLDESLDVPRGEPVGMGYSLIAESFLNFRELGCALFLVLGWIIAYSYFRFRLYRDRFSGLQAANLVVLLALHLRNDSMTYARVLVWGAALIWIARWIDRRGRERAPSAAPGRRLSTAEQLATKAGRTAEMPHA